MVNTVAPTRHIKVSRMSSPRTTNRQQDTGRIEELAEDIMVVRDLKRNTKNPQTVEGLDKLLYFLIVRHNKLKLTGYKYE